MWVKDVSSHKAFLLLFEQWVARWVAVGRKRKAWPFGIYKEDGCLGESEQGDVYLGDHLAAQISLGCHER